MFKPASKNQSKLRLAFFGVAGAGKTYTSLRIATGMNSVLKGKIALIDSERGRAEKYADLFKFDICTLDKKTIDDYEQAILEAARNKYDILIIDSLTHAWQELLVEIDNIAKARFGGNTWSAWSKGTPKQQKFINIILEYPGHVIATMRSKSEWIVETNDKGKNAPKRVGTTPEQGKGIEYEFDIIGNITDEHFLVIQKDITGKYQDLNLEKPDEKFGIDIINWLSTGQPVNTSSLDQYLNKNEKPVPNNIAEKKVDQPTLSREQKFEQIENTLGKVGFGFLEEFCKLKKFIKEGQSLQDLSDEHLNLIFNKPAADLKKAINTFVDSKNQTEKTVKAGV